MHEQTITMRGVPILIATAHGVIELHREYGDRRKLKIILPDGLMARVGPQAVERSPWVDLVDGRIVPKYRVLEAEVDSFGALKGLRPGKGLRVSVPETAAA